MLTLPNGYRMGERVHILVIFLLPDNYQGLYGQLYQYLA